MIPLYRYAKFILCSCNISCAPDIGFNKVRSSLVVSLRSIFMQTFMFNGTSTSHPYFKLCRNPIKQFSLLQSWNFKRFSQILTHILYISENQSLRLVLHLQCKQHFNKSFPPLLCCHFFPQDSQENDGKFFQMFTQSLPLIFDFSMLCIINDFRHFVYQKAQTSTEIRLRLN